MPFPFTFISNVPGTVNPFARPSSLSESEPQSAKRGWHPAFAEPSTSTTTLTSTTGYLYPPARSGDDFMRSSWTLNPHIDHHEQELPPLKKRRGLAGTIISTAVNAALIGSAVGLTLYRLWANRGKQQQQRLEAASPESLSPPPPYDAPSYHQQHFKLPDPSPKKPRQAPRQSKSALTQHRRKKSHHHHHHHHPLSSSSSDPFFPTAQPEFDFGSEPHGDPVEDKMDLIGGKLGMLIEQGKRALNAHVVVSSDAIEDEVDDGSDAWEEENNRPSSAPPSRSGSVRRSKRPKTLNLSASHPSSPFPVSSSAPNTSFLSCYSALPASQSTTSLNNISIEDPSTFESRELREGMERARQRLMARRLGGT